MFNPHLDDEKIKKLGLGDPFALEGTDLNINNINEILTYCNEDEVLLTLNENGALYFDNYVPGVEIYIIKDYTTKDEMIKTNIIDETWDFQDWEGVLIAYKKKG